MLYYSNNARRKAREKIAELNRKLSEVPLNGQLNLDDIGNLHGYLRILDAELKREILDNPD